MAITFDDLPQAAHGLRFDDLPDATPAAGVESVTPRTATPQEAQTAIDAVRSTNLALTTSPGGFLMQAAAGGYKSPTLLDKFGGVAKEAGKAVLRATPLATLVPEVPTPEALQPAKQWLETSVLPSGLISREEIQSTLNKLSDSRFWSGNLPERGEGQPTLEAPKVGTTAQVLEGGQHFAAKTADFFTSPEGMALLGIGGLPEAAQKAAGTIFAAQAAHALPELSIKLAQSKDASEATDTALSILTSLGIMGGAAFHLNKAPSEVPSEPARVEPTVLHEEQVKAATDAALSEISPTAAKPSEPLLPEPGKASGGEPLQDAGSVVVSPIADLNSSATQGALDEGASNKGIAGATGENGTLLRDASGVTGEGAQADTGSVEIPAGSGPIAEGGEIVTSPNLKADEAQFIQGLKEHAKEQLGSLGPGAASGAEFMQRYATVGASHIAEGKTNLADWSREMVKDIGPQIAPDLGEIWERSKQIINDFSGAQSGARSETQRQIDRSTGVTTPAAKESVEVDPIKAQKGALRQAEKAGEAGFKRGTLESAAKFKPVIQSLKSELGQSLSRAQGLSEYFRGMEKGSRIGTDAARRGTRAELRMADKWMEADKERVRRSMVNAVQSSLPLAERGRFLGAITRALKRPDLLRGDPATMYKNAFRVMQAIEGRAHDVYRGGLVANIKKASTRAVDSPSVDLKFKQLISSSVEDVRFSKLRPETTARLEKTRDYLTRMAAKGEDVFMPGKVLEAIEALEKTPAAEVPTPQLEALYQRVALLERLGRMRNKSNEAAWDMEKQDRLASMLSVPAQPMEMRQIFKPQPGESLSFTDKVNNWLARRLNGATVFDLGHMPEDVIFDMLQGGKGTYEGPLFEHLRTPIDASYDAAHKTAEGLLAPVREIIVKHKLSDTDSELVGLWAAIQQKGGEQRALESGVTQSTIDKLKAKGLTGPQRESYETMRRALDVTLPRVQAVMHDLFNLDVGAVENYFPWQRDHEKFVPGIEPMIDPHTGKEIDQNQLDAFGKIAGNFYGRNTTKTPRGFTLEREKGAATPIRFDAFNVFGNHIAHAAKLIEMQRPLKLAGELIGSDPFAEHYGLYGQKLMREWLTAAATDGAGGSYQRWAALDMARRATSRSAVFFRLVSNIKHASAIPAGMVNAGGAQYWWKGLHESFSGSGKDFITKFPQVYERQAGEMSLQELQRHVVVDPEGVFQKGMSLADKYGFILGKELDQLNSQATFIGRYLKNLEEKDVHTGLDGPVDTDAAYNAIAYMRRTVSSTLAKDVQPVLGRGMGFGGYVSIARVMNQFRQYALERYSQLRYDVPASFKSGNYTRGIALMMAATAAGLYETNIQSAVTHGWNALWNRGEDSKKEHESWLSKLMLDGFSMFPYANNAVAMARWGETGVALIDSAVKAVESTGGLYSAGKRASENPAADSSAIIRQKAIKAAGAVAQISGVPGASTATQLASFALNDPDEIKAEQKQLRQSAPRSRNRQSGR